MTSKNAYKYYEKLVFKSTDSPTILDLSTDLTTEIDDGNTYRANSVTFVNISDGTIDVELSYDGTNYGDIIRFKSRETKDITSSGLYKIRITHTGIDAGYECLASTNNIGETIYRGGTTNAAIYARDTASVDAFGRWRVSNPDTLFDSKNIFNDSDLVDSLENQPLFFDNQEVSGSGTSTTYNSNESSATISVGSAIAGKRVRQTKRRFNYQPGKSILAFLSFIMGEQTSGVTKAEGLFDDNNGLFFQDTGSSYGFVRRSYVTGSAIDTFYEKSEWNIDPMDGTGVSGVDLDFTKTNILAIDFEWLGVGRVRFGFVVDGNIYYAHALNNANNLDKVYMSSPNLPIRTEIENDGTGITSNMTQICNSVISEGGQNPTGLIRYASTAGSQITCATEGTIYAIIGIRLKTNYIGATIKILRTLMQLQTASDRVEYILKYNPTVTGTLTYSDESRSSVQIALGDGTQTITGGIDIDGGFLESGGNASGRAGSTESEIDNVLTLGTNIDNTRDEIILCARPIGGSSNVDVEGAMSWRELN